MRVIAAVFGPYAPDALPSHVSVFSHDFKRFEQLTKLATSSFLPPIMVFLGAKCRRGEGVGFAPLCLIELRRCSGIVGDKVSCYAGGQRRGRLHHSHGALPLVI